MKQRKRLVHSLSRKPSENNSKVGERLLAVAQIVSKKKKEKANK